MNAYTTEPHTHSIFSASPVLIAGDSDAALDRAGRTVEAAGARIGAILPLGAAADRIALQASASAVWIELDQDGGPAMDRLLQQVSSDVVDGRYSAIVAASNDLVDVLFCGIGGSPVQLVIDGDEAERTAALA